MVNRDTQIFNKIEININQYIDKFSKPLKVKLDKERGKYNYALELLYKFYLINNYLFDNIFEPIEGDNDLLLSLCSKSSLNIFGIYNCLNNGLFIESTILIRSLFETYVNVELISREDSYNRLKLFSNFHYIEVYNHLKENERLLEKGIINKLPVNKDFRKKIIEKFNQVKNDYNPSRPYHWAWKIFKDDLKNNQNPSLKFICSKLGSDFEFDYLKLYSTFSKPVHSSPTIQNVIKKGDVISNAPQFNDLLFGDVYITIDYNIKIIKRTLEYYKPKDYNDFIIYLENYDSKILTLLESYK